MNPQCPKVTVIGLDGATFDVIGPWLSQGKLPVLHSLIENGTAGKLKSTIPSMSPVAWPSFYTGVNPGNHGIFDFFSPKRQKPIKMIINSGANCHAAPFWKHFDKAGFKTGTFNVPMTFPPDNLENGFMISGLDTPDLQSEFTWPPALKDEISKKVGQYIIEATHTPETTRDPKKYLNLVLEVIEVREKTALHLLDNYELDVFTIVFTATDRAQHTLWKYMDKGHIDHVPGFENHILTIFQRVDKALGRILEKIGRQGDIIIMSDHGFQPVEKTIDLNQWLRENGYQTLKKNNFMDVLKFYGRDIYKKIMKPVLGSKEDDLRWPIEEIIDWNTTKAYYIGAWGCLFINLAGREPNGIVKPGEEYDTLLDKLQKDLNILKDPDTNKSIIKSVLKRDDIYTGRFLDQSPDLTIIWEKNYNGSKSVFERSRNILRSAEVVTPAKRFSGDHEENGIFVFHSPKGKTGKKIKNASIMDICPTLFYLLGQKVPTYLEGQVLTEIFKEDHLSKNAVKYTDDLHIQSHGSGVLSHEDEDMIADRLKDLGYME